MPIIALTGGIGSGKSEAAKQFAKQGVPVVDVDVIAHELTAAGEPTLSEISHTFGADFLNTDGTLNRAKLRAHVFEHEDERLKLEEILHPAIQRRALSQLAANEHELKPAYQIIVIPLLFESDRYASIVDKAIVVDCDEQLQIQRAMARSQLSEAQVKAIMDAQVSRVTRLSLADEVIENNGSLAELTKKISEIHEKLIKTCIVSK
ncbi:MAG TPA: dephospho-CoA kinase [Methylotenera sp.]|nr:dephospho-CoA kinase [Methylotenera sp.]